MEGGSLHVVGMLGQQDPWPPRPNLQLPGGSRNGNGVRWSALLKRNGVQRSRLLTWELLLFQLTDDHYRSDARLIPMLQSVRQLLEQDLSCGFAFEEGGLYADSEDLPVLSVLVRQLHQEHDALRKHLESLEQHLNEATALDKSKLIRASGAAFAQAFRAHMRRDEQELLPLVEARYRTASQQSI